MLMQDDDKVEILNQQTFKEYCFPRRPPDYQSEIAALELTASSSVGVLPGLTLTTYTVTFRQGPDSYQASFRFSQLKDLRQTLLVRYPGLLPPAIDFYQENSLSKYISAKIHSSESYLAERKALVECYVAFLLNELGWTKEVVKVFFCKSTLVERTFPVRCPAQNSFIKDYINQSSLAQTDTQPNVHQFYCKLRSIRNSLLAIQKLAHAIASTGIEPSEMLMEEVGFKQMFGKLLFGVRVAKGLAEGYQLQINAYCRTARQSDKGNQYTRQYCRGWQQSFERVKEERMSSLERKISLLKDELKQSFGQMIAKNSAIKK